MGYSPGYGLNWEKEKEEETKAKHNLTTNYSVEVIHSFVVEDSS